MANGGGDFGATSRRRWMPALGVLGVVAIVVLAVLGSKDMLAWHKKGGGSSSSSSTDIEVKGGPQASDAAIPAANRGKQQASEAPTPAAAEPSPTPDSPAPAPAGADEEDKEEHATVEGDVCYAETSGQLREAVEDEECSTVILTNTDKYEVEDDEEIIVSRVVTVQGSVARPPMLVAEDCIRFFRVKAGGYLTLRNVQMKPSEGQRDPKYNFGERELSQLEEITGQDHREAQGAAGDNFVYRDVRGGCVLFERDALGGLFVGVYFIEEDPLQDAIDLMMAQTTVRVYGEFVLSFGGEVDFVNCVFWDYMPLLPVTNYLYFGGWVLVFEGTMTFSGCSFFELNGFGWEIGLGLNFGVLGGQMIMSYSQFFETNLATAMISIGEAFLVGYGTAVFTGVSFVEWSGVLYMVGTGPFTVVGGNMINTGVFNAEAIGIGAQFGAGMEWSVGAGVLVNIGVTMVEIYNLFIQGTAGEISFLGEGTWVSIGSPNFEYANIVGEYGAGAFGYIGGGVASFVGSPAYESVTIGGVFGIGEFFALDDGVMVWYGAPFMEFIAIEYLAVLGNALYVGAGGLYVAQSPMIEYFIPVLLYTVLTIEFYANGGCEPVEEAGGAPVPGTDMVPPIFVNWFTGCDKWGIPVAAPLITDLASDWFAGVEPDDYGWVKQLAVSRRSEMARGPPHKNRATASSEEGDAIDDGPVPAAIEETEETPGGRRDRTLLVPADAAVAEDEPVAVVEEEAQTAVAPMGSGSKEHRDRRKVRRRMTTLKSILQEGIMAIEEVGLQVRGVPKVTATPEHIQALNIPDDWKASMTSVYNAIKGMGGGEAAGDGDEEQEEQQNITVFVNNKKPHGLCYICDSGAAHVEGAGAKHCIVQETCSPDFDPPSIITAAGKPGETVSSASSTDIIYTPYTITTAKTVPTVKRGTDIPASAVQEAAIEALSTLLGDSTTVIVNVYPGLPSLPKSTRRALQSFLHDLPISAAQTDEHDSNLYFKLTFIAADKETGEEIKSLIQRDGEEDEPKGGLSDLIKKNLALHHGVAVGSLGLEKTWSITLPAYDGKEMSSSSHAGQSLSMGARTVMLVDPQQPAVPVTTTHYDRQYTLHLEQFAPNTKISIQLLKQTSLGNVPASITTLSVTTDDSGAANLDFTFKPMTTLPGDYFFKATSTVDNMYGESPIYPLLKRSYERRLYGPSVYI